MLKVDDIVVILDMFFKNIFYSKCFLFEIFKIVYG